MRINGWITTLAIAGATMALAACGTVPSEPRYSTRPMALPAPAEPAPAPYEAPPPASAPIEPIEGGALPPPVSVAPRPTPAPVITAPGPSTPAPAVIPPGGVAYVIQPGDTISGVGRRFQTPVQTLIDLNNLGPRAAISPGQAIRLPDAAVDIGHDPYATGPSPVGVTVPEAGRPAPPPPPPPSGNPAAPRTMPAAPVPAPRPAPPVVTPTPRPAPPPASAQNAAPAPATSAIVMQWPVRGDVVRRFGPVGMGERNNGINIGAAAGSEVVAAAAGRVAYVGDDLVGQGLTVLIVHRDGWRTVYGHLGSATVDDGADVRAGQQVGTVGLTAGDGRPSMHFETRHMRADEPVAVDPLTVLPR